MSFHMFVLAITVSDILKFQILYLEKIGQCNFFTIFKHEYLPMTDTIAKFTPVNFAMVSVIGKIHI